MFQSKAQRRGRGKEKPQSSDSELSPDSSADESSDSDSDEPLQQRVQQRRKRKATDIQPAKSRKSAAVAVSKRKTVVK